MATPSDRLDVLVRDFQNFGRSLFLLYSRGEKEAYRTNITPRPIKDTALRPGGALPQNTVIAEEDFAQSDIGNALLRHEVVLKERAGRRAPFRIDAETGARERAKTFGHVALGVSADTKTFAVVVAVF